MSTAPQPVLTAEEFGRRPDPGYPEELVRGRIVSMSPPTPLKVVACVLKCNPCNNLIHQWRNILTRNQSDKAHLPRLCNRYNVITLVLVAIPFNGA